MVSSVFLLTGSRDRRKNLDVKQTYHSIFKPAPRGGFLGWVEEVPGTITHAPSLDACRRGLRSSLRTILESVRAEARVGVDASCIEEEIEIDSPAPATVR